MLETLLSRRSCREFKPEPVEEEKKNKLLQAAQLVPSGKDLRPWEFIVIEKKETLNMLGNCRSPEQPFLPDTPLAIVVLADTNKTDVWIEDAALSAFAIQLEAEKLGLGSCWVQIRKRESNRRMDSEEYLRELLYIPEYISVLTIIAVGYPEDKKAPRTLARVELSKIHNERY